MSFPTCSDAQPPWCIETIDDALPSVLGLLPDGAMWTADRKPGTTKNKFWRSIAEVTAFVYKTLCEYEKEFYCDTATLSLDQWNRAWGLGESCDPYGFNLCAKVTGIGGQSYTFFTDIALKSGYVITCEQIDIPEPIAGSMVCGCTPLGPRPIVRGNGSNLGYGALCFCSYGEVVGHPDPDTWEFGADRTGLKCEVPGSLLGLTSGDPDCCFICGYYTVDVQEPPALTDACIRNDVVIKFPQVNSVAAPNLDLLACGADRDFSEYGHSYLWKVTIDVAASNALRNVQPVAETNWSNAGNLQAGCTPLCSEEGQEYIMCLLELIKPAHTKIIYEVTQP